ncbi:MAG: ammonium transporter [Candidatus Latescibacteria bacterium]|nr:ammonium transporter [Candidatus Latescibacterota bacterium]
MNENPKPRAIKHILFALKIAAVMIGGALLLTLARKQGWIDGEQVIRANNVIMGLALAAYFNAMPKMLHGPLPDSIPDATMAQTLGRVNGWAMTLAFLAWAVLWAFAPQELAQIGSIAAVGTSAAVTIGYMVWKLVARRTARSV